MRISTVLYQDEISSSSRTISAEVEKGLLRIDLQDIWKKRNGSDEYESCMYNIAAPKVMELLNVTSGKKILEELKKRFFANTAFDDISSFLSNNNIAYDYYSD